MIMLVVDLPAVKGDDCFNCEMRHSCHFYVNSAEAPCIVKGTVEGWLESFNTESATACYTAIQELKKQIGGEK